MSGNNKNDVFEEFEFKPLTEGLGFHKKSIDLKAETQASGLVETREPLFIPTLPETFLEEADAVPKSYAELTERPGVRRNLVEEEFLAGMKEETSRPSIHQPLPRTGRTEKQRIEKKDSYFTPELNLNFKESAEKAIKESSSITTEDLKNTEGQVEYKMIRTNMTSAIFDAIVAFTFSILFLVAMITITKVDIVELVFNAKTQFVIQGSLVLMYLAILQLYMIISRIVGGATLGEWAFDVHVAEKNNRRSGLFALMVIARSVVSLLTGLVVLPLLSFVLRRDLAGAISGAYLFQQK